jgi:hypothetical protein
VGEKQRYFNATASIYRQLTQREIPLIRGNVNLVVFYLQNDTKQIKTLCGENEAFLDVKADGTYIYRCDLTVQLLL